MFTSPASVTFSRRRRMSKLSTPQGCSLRQHEARVGQEVDQRGVGFIELGGESSHLTAAEIAKSHVLSLRVGKRPWPGYIRQSIPA